MNSATEIGKELVLGQYSFVEILVIILVILAGGVITLIINWLLSKNFLNRVADSQMKNFDEKFKTHKYECQGEILSELLEKIKPINEKSEELMVVTNETMQKVLNAQKGSNTLFNNLNKKVGAIEKNIGSMGKNLQLLNTNMDKITTQNNISAHMLEINAEALRYACGDETLTALLTAKASAMRKYFVGIIQTNIRKLNMDVIRAQISQEIVALNKRLAEISSSAFVEYFYLTLHNKATENLLEDMEYILDPTRKLNNMSAEQSLASSIISYYRKSLESMIGAWSKFNKGDN